ncbi:MAG: hypothetical protein NC823_01705 [Candidatus Omnitrophica bacterium]|nr:hypothetical protein [Candidatus Omnitrophota bacterium]
MLEELADQLPGKLFPSAISRIPGSLGCLDAYYQPEGNWLPNKPGFQASPEKNNLPG